MKTLTLLLCLLSSCAFGQAPSKTPVHLQIVSKDSVGSRIVVSLRDLIAASPRYRPEDGFYIKVGEDWKPVWSIRIVSSDPDETSLRTVMAVAITEGNTFEDMYISTCGSNRVKECAEDIIAELDSSIENRQEIRNMLHIK